MSEEVEYLGHIVTPQGLMPNKGNLDTIKEFPGTIDVKHLRQFLGLTSHFLKVHPELCQDCSTFVL